MLWLGDNVYFREPDDSKTGVYHRYTHDKSTEELQGLLGRFIIMLFGMIMITVLMIQIKFFRKRYYASSF